MSKIQVMDTDLANKIAAGEVVEKCMNVVKELVENSIDAESTIIKIELIDSGVKEIKVTDNGIGMDESDAVLAFSRHATSKLKTLDDLFNINSLGFRGEALPSIASVSNVVLKTSNGKVGTLVSINGGSIESVIPCDLKQGTTITVNDLFYNTPVHLKYLKSLYTELSHITDYVSKMALSYPNIKFVLINNEKELINTSGSGDLLKAILNIYGVVVASKMIEINKENDDYKIYGYISYPELTKSNRSGINLLINNRVVRNNDIVKTIMEAYYTYIPKERYPYIVINIEVDPFLVDVNVHPTKMEVKFSKLDSLKTLIYNAISEKLSKRTLIQKANSDIIEDNFYETVPSNSLEINESVNKEELKFDFDTNKIVSSEKVKLEAKDVKNDLVSNLNIENKENVGLDRIKPMTPLAIIHKTYIVCENEEGMFLIDQHAAAERINYEKVLDSITNHENNYMDVLIPYKIELPKSEYLILEKNFYLLDLLGISYEEFSDNTILIRRHPVWLSSKNTYECLKKIIEIIIEKEEFDEKKFLDRVAASVACRMSIMAGDFITLEEASALIEELRHTRNPFNCAHGRPSIITYTNYDLEKMFKRSM
ncbi:MAG: DNA mismatch repair endonuclease MutL [Bacilli bacterium]|nr:DNA mismatch repair endonuclease MutL [Bacilli bacterium]